MVTRGRVAQQRPARLANASLSEAASWLDQYRQFWEQSYDRLDEHLRGLTDTEATTEKPKTRKGAKQGP